MIDIGDIVILLTGFTDDSLECMQPATISCIVDLDFNDNSMIDIGDFVLLLTGMTSEDIEGLDGGSCFLSSE